MFSTPGKPVVSAVTQENVAVRVSSHVARTKRRGFARIYGTVTPAVVGAQVGVLRIARPRHPAGGTVVKPRNSISWQFSRVVRVQKAPTACSSRSPWRRRIGVRHALLIHCGRCTR